MNQNNITKKTGMAIAFAVAGLASGCANNQSANNSSAKQAATLANNTTDLVHCYDVNVCKGHNDCKTAENACAGQASCKGHGFVGMPSKACRDVGGKVKDKWVGPINKADLSHCYNVNLCKGHNDCKTAENACAGRASCKGHGFVAMPAKACTDIGGKNG